MSLQLAEALTSFSVFYGDKHGGRKLTWTAGRSGGEIKTTAFQRQFILVVSVYQMTILLLFNDHDVLRQSEILSETQIDPQLFDQVITIE